MNKKLLTSYIRAVIAEKLDLGKIAFGGERRDNVPFEEDTEEESNLLTSIVDYLDGTKQLPSIEVDAIKRFLGEERYSDVFVKPAASHVYRGMFLSPEVASKMTGIEESRFREKMGKETGEFVVASREGLVTSWSKSFSTALNFGRNALRKYGSKGDVIVVFKAATGDNDGDMLDLDPIYKKVDHPVMATRWMESEVLGLGSIKAIEVKWYQNF